MHDAFGRIGRLIIDGTRPPTGPNFTRFGMLRRTSAGSGPAADPGVPALVS